MNDIDERLRDYYSALAQAVRPGAIRDTVQLPPDRSPGGGPGRRPRRSWLAPLAAATAVAAAAIMAVTLGAVIGPGRPPHGPPPPSDGQSAAQLVAAGVVPPRFVTITAGGDPYEVPSVAAVRSTATGAQLAVIRPSIPHGTIVAVSAAADDRTFVLAEQELPRARTAALDIEHGSFYLLRLRTDGTVQALTPLPVTAVSGVNAMALSSDGTMLALAIRTVSSAGDSSQIRVYTLATGAARTWSATGAGFVGDGMGGADDAASLSWAADGHHLLFSWVDTSYVFHERLLDTTIAGHSLIAASRTVLTIPVTGGLPLCQGDVIITPDASAVICPAANGDGSGQTTVSFREYSTADGVIIRQLGTRTYPHIDQFLLGALWADPSGSVLIGVIPVPGPGQARPGTGPGPAVTPSPPPGSTPAIGIITSRGFTPLGLPGITSGAW